MAFPRLIVELVWQRALLIDAKNESMGFRKDQCGAWIQWQQYGNRYSLFGWEIDHVVPKNRGGSDYFWNLRPLHWQNNIASSDDGLRCAVTSSGTANVQTIDQ